jgi:hypothetical protein
MTEDEMIARACGVEVPKYVCGHVKGFSMGFGYSDPLAKCRSCRDRAVLWKMAGCLAVVLVAVLFSIALVLGHE